MRPSNDTTWARAASLVVALAWASFAPPARAQAQDFNGLWWNRYNAFQPSPDVAPGLWWDHYQPPARPVWNGPYYTVDHWDPYVPRPVAWSPLVYNLSDAPPQSTRPSGFYAQFTPGPLTYPGNATEFWRYIWPELSPETRSLIGSQLAGTRAAAEEYQVPVVPRQGFKEYYRKHALGPLKGGYWQEREGPVYDTPPGPRVIHGDGHGFTQYYRPTGQAYWVLKPARPKTTPAEPKTVGPKK
ncbi:MAG: hypothetical protein P4L84_12605 [Isosphaeraceae bacterium]|nr:hypothetical protein [Isosphaeraceae bacterium]